MLYLMFDGIVKGKYRVKKIERRPGLLSYAILVDAPFLTDIEIGASVAVDGVCQTVVKIDPPLLFFEAIETTLQITTLKHLSLHQEVNLARSLRFGSEIGGHLLSGHIIGTATLVDVKQEGAERLLTLSCPPSWMKYFFPKGFLALDGASLTLQKVWKKDNLIQIALIPLTQQLTTLGSKPPGSEVNIEIDSFTQMVVDTTERFLSEKT